MTPSSSFNKFLHITRSFYFFIFVILFCLFSYLFLDRQIALFISQYVPKELIQTASIITFLGHGAIYYTLVPLAWLMAKYYYKNKEWTQKFSFFFIAMVAISLIDLALKIILGRPRPFMLLEHHLYQLTFFKFDTNYWSFPSGHTIMITTIMLCLSFLFPRFWLSFVMVFIIIALTRLIVNAHYLSDTIGAIYLSILVVPWVYKKYYLQHLKN